MRTDTILSSTTAPFHQALRTHHAILPARRAEERNGGGTGNGGGPSIDKASGTQTPASHHPPSSEEQTDEHDDGTASTRQPSNTTQQGEPFQNSERARARERHGKEASRQAAAMPAAANRPTPAHPTPGGRGTNSSRQVEKNRQEGVGRDEKDALYLYRNMGTLRIYPIQSQSENRQASSPRVCIEKMRAIKKIAPVAPKERKKQRSERGLTPTGLIGGGNKQLIAKSHSKKNDQRTLDKARFKIYPITRTQSTDRKDIHKIDTFIAHHPRSKQRHPPPAWDRYDRQQYSRRRPPRSPTRASGAGKREERGSEMSGTRGEPQP